MVVVGALGELRRVVQTGERYYALRTSSFMVCSWIGASVRRGANLG